MFLFIDTTDPDRTSVGLMHPSGEFAVRLDWAGRMNQSEELLEKIEEVLTSASLDKSDVKKIIVITGPGSYTGLRVGLASANALAFALNIPMLGLSVDEWQQVTPEMLLRESVSPVHAFYANAPHITKSKSLGQKC